jgi:ParB-like chromosome segregation protein Spo0J
METAIMKLNDIYPAEYNPRKTLKPGDTEYEALKNSLERFGLAEPLIVNKATERLISGHQRLNVLKASGIKEAEVVLVELNEDQEKLLNIALNKIDGDWDYEKLENLFEDIKADDIKFTGFTPEELRNLFDSDFSDLEGDEEKKSQDVGDKDKNNKNLDIPEESSMLKEFNIFLSFPTKEIAEKWLKDREINLGYSGTTRNITIKMEGLAYGARN